MLNMITCDYMDFEETIERTIKMGKTPLLVDSSPDQKVCTYFGYQLNVQVFNAQEIVAEWFQIYLSYITSTNVLIQQDEESKQLNPTGTYDLYEEKLKLLNKLRRSLVQAMKFGQLLVINLGTSAPDFMNLFSDEALEIDNTERSSAYFPLETLYQGGILLHEPINNLSLSKKNQKQGKPNYIYYTWYIVLLYGIYENMLGYIINYSMKLINSQCNCLGFRGMDMG